MIKASDLPYRPCVGVVIFNKQGQVWSGRRLMNPELTGADGHRWQFPQGGIDKGECADNAAIRELYEETGIKNVSALGSHDGWFTYDLPDELIGIALKGKFRGQKQKWFAYLLEGDENEIAINPPPNGNVAEFDAWEWIDLEVALTRIVPFKRDLYAQVINAFIPIRDHLLSKR